MERAIIFDVDGTLAETEETHREAFNVAFHRAGLPWHWDQALYARLLAVTGGKERIRHYIENYGAEGVPAGDLDGFIKALHAAKTAAYTELVSGGGVELRPGIRELIETAREKGYRLAIATTTTPANIVALLAATFGEDGRELFEAICAGDSVPNKKPAPDVFLKALAELDLPAASCVALEDSRNGLLSAIAAGIATIVTPGIYTSGEDFSGASIVVDHLEVLDFAEIEAVFTQ